MGKYADEEEPLIAAATTVKVNKTSAFCHRPLPCKHLVDNPKAFCFAGSHPVIPVGYIVNLLVVLLAVLGNDLVEFMLELDKLVEGG